jgi:hypothetical protein
MAWHAHPSRSGPPGCRRSNYRVCPRAASHRCYRLGATLQWPGPSGASGVSAEGVASHAEPTSSGRATLRGPDPSAPLAGGAAQALELGTALGNSLLVGDQAPHG